jgi:hypothetical protein
MTEKTRAGDGLRDSDRLPRITWLSIRGEVSVRILDMIPSRTLHDLRTSEPIFPVNNLLRGPFAEDYVDIRAVGFWADISDGGIMQFWTKPPQPIQ